MYDQNCSRCRNESVSAQMTVPCGYHATSQDRLLEFVKNKSNISKSVEGSMEKRMATMTQNDITGSPNYIGMNTLLIPAKIADAIEQREETRQQAKRNYGYQRENMVIEADNTFVLALDEYVRQQVDKALNLAVIEATRYQTHIEKQEHPRLDAKGTEIWSVLIAHKGRTIYGDIASSEEQAHEKLSIELKRLKQALTGEEE